jgi:hypothetical protein
MAFQIGLNFIPVTHYGPAKTPVNRKYRTIIDNVDDDAIHTRYLSM